MTRREALEIGAARLRDAGIEAPRLEARLLLGHATGLDQASLLAAPEAPVEARYFELLARRGEREPLAYITGRREFWSLAFEVSSATLIPRPESETLIEMALAACPERAGVRHVLDLGTGSGCLLLAALSEFTTACGIGVDRAPDAIGVAKRNAARLGFADRAAFLVGDWAAAIHCALRPRALQPALRRAHRTLRPHARGGPRAEIGARRRHGRPGRLSAGCRRATPAARPGRAGGSGAGPVSGRRRVGVGECRRTHYIHARGLGRDRPGDGLPDTEKRVWQDGHGGLAYPLGEGRVALRSPSAPRFRLSREPAKANVGRHCGIGRMEVLMLEHGFRLARRGLTT